MGKVKAWGYSTDATGQRWQFRVGALVPAQVQAVEMTGTIRGGHIRSSDGQWHLLRNCTLLRRLADRPYTLKADPKGPDTVAEAIR